MNTFLSTRRKVFSKKYLFKLFNNLNKINNYSVNIKALPFKISRNQAENILSENKSILEKNTSGTSLQIYNKDPIESKFIPFHSMDIQDLKSTYVGEYGIDRLETYWYYNAATKTMMPSTRTVTDWYRCQDTVNPTKYPIGTLETQIYAGFKYPSRLVEKSLRTDQIKNMIKFNKELLNFEPGKIKIEPHEMKISFALEKMISQLYELEKKRVLNYIEKKYSADHSEIHSLDMHINESSINLQSYYLPTYIYELNVGDNQNTFRFVSGFSGEYSGYKIWSPSKFFFIGSVLGTALSFHPAFRTAGILAKLFMGAGFGIPPALFAKILPNYKINKDSNQIKNDFDINKQKEETNEDRERYEYLGDNVNNDNKSKINFKKKYCTDKLKLLGLSPDGEITIPQIKTAYYAQVKKYHPDIYKGNKDFAKIMTQQLNDAYRELIN